MADIKEFNFDKYLRIEAQKELDRLDITWYKLAKLSGIDPIQNIYHFRDGGGLNGENTWKLMKYLGLEVSDFE